VLTQYEKAWYYKRNLTPLPDMSHSWTSKSSTVFTLAPTELLDVAPNLPPGAPELDLAGDGYRRFAATDPRLTGFYRTNVEEKFESFRTFETTTNQSLQDRTRFLDLDGDGMPELLFGGQDVSYHRLGQDGIEGSSNTITHPVSSLLFCNDMETVYLADFSGDGLTDVVRIRNGETYYWPNLGNGEFGGKIVLDNSP